MQFQADLLGIPVERPSYTETTALGAAMLAALGIGLYSEQEEVANLRELDKVFLPTKRGEEMEERYLKWKKAVKRAEGWLDEKVQ